METKDSGVLVYKYIKNLRAKIEGDKLKNVPSGGFILTE